MPREAPRQLPLVLPHEPREGAEDFLVAGPNADAHALVCSWPGWPDRTLLLAGPEGSGKSHLASIWRAASGAVAARDAGEALALATGGDERRALLLDDADREGADEVALFHLMNAARERGLSMLLVARSAPTLLWPSLPDLASRLRALPIARLEAPDDDLVRAVLVKLLDERQLAVEAGVVEYIARRVDRSLATVRGAVDALDRESLARGRAVGRGLASDVLARLAGQED